MQTASRPYRDADDLKRMIALAREVWALEGPHDYPPGQLCWEVPRLRASDQVQLWEDSDGTLLAAVLFYPGLGHGDILPPHCRNEGLEENVQAWIEEACAEASREMGRKIVPETSANAGQARRIAMLGRLG